MNPHFIRTVSTAAALDAGLQYLTHADGHRAAWRVQNYGILPSQVGLKGREELGGGWHALFKLEQGLNLNDGTATAPGYAFFRGAYLGIAGPAGTVTFGRQFSVLFDKTLFYDPLWYASYSGQGVIVPMSANFIDHSIKYQSPTFGGFDVAALAATAGVAGNTRAGRVLELGGQYTSNGLSVSARGAAPGARRHVRCRRCVRAPRATRSTRCRSPSTRASNGSPATSTRRAPSCGAARAT